MRRRLLLTVLFSLTAWSALAWIGSATADTTADAAAIVLDTNGPSSGTTGDPNARWEAAHRPGVSLPECPWKLTTSHADLGAARSVTVFIATDEVLRRASSSRVGPARLLNVPLLI